MPLYTKESLEKLRQRIDLVDLLSSHLELTHAGAMYKARCPFHDEKTPSFMIRKGDTHYHCFGCGAHGDAIQFLMNHTRVSFMQAVESLAERYQVPLERIEFKEEKGPNKLLLKSALDLATQFFHFSLLHLPEGEQALRYLYQRGITLEFIKTFAIGFAPTKPGMLQEVLSSKGITLEQMHSAGLLSMPEGVRHPREFFSDRITFPIRDAQGAVIGFSARKYKEETFGGKYINTPETPLFKKSKILFGLNYSRKRIAKDRRALIVEGQIDALRLIYEGFNFTVAGQGTAFGQGHVQELLNLGITQVYLALDSDEAGQQATEKIGNLFQHVGVEVKIVQLPQGQDPDSFLRKSGCNAFVKALESAEEYLAFLVRRRSRAFNVDSPAGKNAWVHELVRQIQQWEEPLVVHESLKRLSQLTQTPPEFIGVGQQFVPNMFVQKTASAGMQQVDPDKVLETDFLRLLLFIGGQFPLIPEIAKRNINKEDFKNKTCQKIYQLYQTLNPFDLLSLMSLIESDEEHLLLSELSHRKINKERAIQQFEMTVQRILERNWMEKREALKEKIHSGQGSEDEVLALVKQFDDLKRSPPVIIKN